MLKVQVSDQDTSISRKVRQAPCQHLIARDQTSAAVIDHDQKVVRRETK